MHPHPGSHPAPGDDTGGKRKVAGRGLSGLRRTAAGGRGENGGLQRGGGCGRIERRGGSPGREKYVKGGIGD